jgi:hypothetical protein
MVAAFKVLDINKSDEEFNFIYPRQMREISQTQWTPVEVAKLAAKYLAEKPGTKVLDIGSGIGKFCMIGASCTQGQFTGVEQRLNLVEIANRFAGEYGIKNVNYIHANITDVVFSDYEAFYFFNAFYENIDMNAVIDNTVSRGIAYYNLYNRYVSGQLAKMPVGTKLVTYWSPLIEIPANYQVQFSAFEENLKFWKKIS